ncbi:hypothetical protein CARUB_v10028414mg [Capsella rubella]|uniref:F-box domain-containing protein n=1 Tax=Capsella rubella TaxID=81985 RepID=R0GRV1_9BRAS|nr:hypothetical protein CARUB_v10028414mg [Capsella rubella]
MATLSCLSDDLLVKILSFLPTKVAVSTSILSKQWKFLWMWLPKLDYLDYRDITNSCTSKSTLVRYRDFIDKYLPLHRALVIESLRLIFTLNSVQPEDIKPWAAIAVSRCVRELSISYYSLHYKSVALLPCSLYTCKSLVTLKLEGKKILVDVPQMVFLPLLKNLELEDVTYANEDSLKLLVSSCPVLEDLSIERYGEANVGAIVVISSSLQRFYLSMYNTWSSDGFLIDTPSLKYFKVVDWGDSISPEADINGLDIEDILKSITTVKRLSLDTFFSFQEESVDSVGIAFNQLEHLKLHVANDNWSMLLVPLLKYSPKLRVLNLHTDVYGTYGEYYEQGSIDQSSVPKCLCDSLETFEFSGYIGTPEERDFLTFILKNVRPLKSLSISSKNG